jgi:hypothetical protein
VIDRLLLARIFFGPAALITALVAGCGGDDDGGNGSCGDDQVEVAYLGGDDDGRTECAPIPAECGATASCANDACRGALYGLCESPYLGVACSDTLPPTIVSCNP